jgi:hypothetical protein
MHELALEQRRDLGVRAPWHVGDITWGLFQHEGREDEWEIRIWKDGDRTVAWSWLKGDRGLLELDSGATGSTCWTRCSPIPTLEPRSRSRTTRSCRRLSSGTASHRTPRRR